MKSNPIFSLSIFIALMAVLLIFLAGSLLSHLFGLDSIGPMVGKSPFGVGIGEGGGPSGGISGWIIAIQSQFSHAMTGTLDRLKTEAGAIWTLLGFSLAYGVFHAAGPGHGKAIIAAYGMADQRDISKIIGMACAAALLQSLVAIGLVGILSLVLHATAATMRQTASTVEWISFAAVALLGAGLLWQKSRSLAGLMMPLASNRYHDHDDHHHPHNHTHSDDHVHDEHCGHNHAPTIASGSDLRGAVAAVIAAGIRPCSGSILVLVFALSQGLFASGILAALAIALGTAITTSALAVLAIFAVSTATRLAGSVDSPRAVLITRSLEVLAAAFVMTLGLALLTGLSQAGS